MGLNLRLHENNTGGFLRAEAPIVCRVLLEPLECSILEPLKWSECVLGQTRVVVRLGVVLGSGSTSVARGSVFLGVDWMLQVCVGGGGWWDWGH